MKNFPKVAFLSVAVLAVALLTTISAVSAHQPQVSDIKEDGQIQEIADPVAASVAVYGALSRPGKIDRYEFTASATTNVPFQVLVPKRPTLSDFRPQAIMVPIKDATPSLDWNNLPPSAVVATEGAGNREIFFEPFSQETYWRGQESRVDLVAGQRYAIFVREDRNQTGDYVLGLGTAENFSSEDFGTLAKNILRIKFGLIGGRTVPWLDIIGLFLLLLGVALSIGSTAGIAVRAFHQEVSSSFQLLLPWAGLGLAIIGTPLVYLSTGFSGMASLQVLIALVILIMQLLMTQKIRKEPGDFKSINHTAAVVAHAWAIFLFLQVWQQMMLR